MAPEELVAGYRLACQAKVLSDVKIEVPRASLAIAQRLQVESQRGAAPATRVGQFAGFDAVEDAVVRSYDVTAQPAALDDPRGDLERVLDALADDYGLPRRGYSRESSADPGPGWTKTATLRAAPAAVRTLSAQLRAHNWRIAALVRGAEILGFLPPAARPLGLAVDLGTTKVAAYLVDMNTGETLAAEGRPNPQIGYGEDVVSRMAYATRQAGGARTLASAVHGTLAELATELATRAGATTQQIVEACIVGNTAMTHLLLELPVNQLANAPYVPAVAEAQEARASDLTLSLLADARAYIPPCVAGFVGADHVAMILATGLDRGDRTALGIDIGTNTEIVLARRGAPRMTSLSCASGPAFEGAHIRYGMRAASGAIEAVQIDPATAGVTCRVIAEAAPVGICGSGILDVIAELHRVNAINGRGRLQAGKPGVRTGRDGLEFLLVPAEATGIGEDIVITQRDVDEVQLAKGAIQAGIVVLLESTGTALDDLDEVVLAGAFGTYLNLERARSPLAYYLDCLLSVSIK